MSLRTRGRIIHVLAVSPKMYIIQNSGFGNIPFYLTLKLKGTELCDFDAA